MQQITYGLGGYDPTKPNDNVVSVEDIEVPDEPTPEPVPADAVIASVAAMTDEQKAALRAALGL